MSAQEDNGAGQEQAIAWLLRYGTWLASAAIATGLAAELLHHFIRGLSDASGFGLMKAGVALFILLPTSRVVLMLGLFFRKRDYIHTAISALVLTIIAVAFLAGRQG